MNETANPPNFLQMKTYPRSPIEVTSLEVQVKLGLLQNQNEYIHIKKVNETFKKQKCYFLLSHN